jgi:hypothetical protein
MKFRHLLVQIVILVVFCIVVWFVAKAVIVPTR